MDKFLGLIIPILLLMVTACQDSLVSGGKLKFKIPETKPTITQVKIVNDQLVVIGSNLGNVTVAKVEGSTNHSFTIETKTANKLILNAKSALSFLVGQTLNLIVSSAEASATFPISFELQNGQVTAAKLHPMGATSGQVLRFNGTTWAPASLTSSQLYAGTYNASTDTPDIVTLGGPSGTYYIVTTSGSQNFGSGLVNFDVGDWVIYNGASWERVPVSGNTVSNFNGRTGIVVPLSGDYSWSMLTKASGKLTGSKLEEIADVDVTGIQDGDIIRWNNSTLKWEVDALPTMTIVAGSISSTELASSSVNSAKITDGSIVDADIAAGAAIAQSKILNLAASLAGKEPVITAGTTLQYLRGDKSLATLNTTVVPEGTNQYFTTARVLGTLLTGYTAGTAVPITASDSIPVAIGKLEAQNAAYSTAQNNYVLLDGTDAMTGNLQMGNNKITGLATPTVNTDAATKAYVDSVAGGGGSSQWTTTGSDIYYSIGNVGIGTSSASFPLDIVSSDAFQQRLSHFSDNDFDGSAIMMVRGRGTSAVPAAVESGNTLGGLYFRAHDGGGTGTTTAAIEVSATQNHTAANKGSRITFETTLNNSSSRSERMRIENNGSVGINTNSPDDTLDVNGNIIVSGKLRFASGANFVELKAPAALASTLTLNLPGTYGTATHVLTTDGAGNLSWSAPAGGAPSGTAGGDLDGTYPNPTVKTGLSVTKLAGGTVDNTEFEYLNGVTSNLQTQLDAKEDAITAGTTLQYLRGDKSLATLNTTVVPEGTNEYFTQGKARATPISGYAVGTAIPLAATDTFMEAFGKLEAQIIANDTAFDNSGQWSKDGTIVYYNGGQVGIGTATPESNLHVASGQIKVSDGSLAAPPYSFSSSGNTGIFKNGNSVAVSVGGSLIGQFNPTGFYAGNITGTELSLNKNSSVVYTPTGAANSPAGSSALFSNGMSGDGISTFATFESYRLGIVSQRAYLGLVTNSTGYTPEFVIGAQTGASSYEERLRISKDGHVGIGTSAPVVKLDANGTVRIGDGGETCSSTISGSIRFNSTTSLTESCDGTNWIPLGNLASIPASSSILMDVCPAGWTDTGVTGGSRCNGVACQMCQSPATEALIPANTTLLMETCPKNWSTLSITSGPTSVGINGLPFSSCQSPAAPSALPMNSKMVMPSCPTEWTDLGETDTGPLSATCGGPLCHVCEIPGMQQPTGIIALSGGSTSTGGNVTLKAGPGGSVSGSGGSARVEGGTPVDGGGGSVFITAKSALSTTASNWNGGDITLSAGNGVTDGNGGNVRISSGDTLGAGTHGHILLNTSVSGFVGIGIASPLYKLDVGGDVNINGASSLLFSGVSVCTSVGCTSSSDKRLKKNINPLENALEKILQIQGVGYEYIDQDKFTDKRQVGVIAQEVEKVYPEAVRTDSKSGFKSVAYDHLIAPVIEALRELNQKITELFSDSKKQSREIASIKEENAKLKQENADIKAYLCHKDPGAPICIN